jgi:hypothetical protein
VSSAGPHAKCKTEAVPHYGLLESSAEIDPIEDNNILETNQGAYHMILSRKEVPQHNGEASSTTLPQTHQQVYQSPLMAGASLQNDQYRRMTKISTDTPSRVVRMRIFVSLICDAEGLMCETCVRQRRNKLR